MTGTVLLGGDLIDALDWLCLNTPNGKKPDRTGYDRYSFVGGGDLIDALDWLCLNTPNGKKL